MGRIDRGFAYTDVGKGREQERKLLPTWMYIRCVSRSGSFAFLGYHHTRAGCMPAQDTIKRFRQRLTQLYEQGASNNRIGAYEIRWWRWVCAGLPECQVLVVNLDNSTLQ